MTSSQFETILPDGWPRPSGYANAVRVPAGHDLLFLAGQIGWDANRRLVGPGFMTQFGQALRNCVELVRAAGGAPGHIVRFTMFCHDKSDYIDRLREVGSVYREIMGDHYPAMSLVEVADLVEDGALIEIEATAAMPPQEPGGR